MDRRSFIGAAGALAAGLAGCLGSGGDDGDAPAGDDTETETPGPDVTSTYIDVEETEDGRVAILLDVVNEGDERRTEPVTMTVTADGEEHADTREVTLDPGEERRLRFEFDVQYDEVAESFDARAEIGE